MKALQLFFLYGFFGRRMADAMKSPDTFSGAAAVLILLGATIAACVLFNSCKKKKHDLMDFWESAPPQKQIPAKTGCRPERGCIPVPHAAGLSGRQYKRHV